MIRFTTTVHKFGEQGEKTGWTYIDIPADLAQKLNPGVKKSFRVKGLLDSFKFSQASLMPMGNGDFIMAINATMRKGTRKKEGAMLDVQIERDDSEIEMPADLDEWLNEDPDARKFFDGLPKSHQHYWMKWIASVKNEQSRISRLGRAITALAQGYGFSEMLRAEKANRLKG